MPKGREIRRNCLLIKIRRPTCGLLSPAMSAKLRISEQAPLRLLRWPGNGLDRPTLVAILRSPALQPRPANPSLIGYGVFPSSASTPLHPAALFDPPLSLQ